MYMNKTELVESVVEKTGLRKKDCDKLVAAFTDAIAETLAKGDKVQIAGFGTFEVRERPAREGRNPQTGEALKIAASKAPAFKAGKPFKEMLN
jgi:DNA-binding protein HU-beta